MAAPADVVFGLGARRAPDAVRVIWASGIVQTETELGAGRAGAAPASRSPSSTASPPRARTSTPGTASASSSSPTSWAAARWGTRRRPACGTSRTRSSTCASRRASSRRATAATSCASPTSSRRCCTSTGCSSSPSTTRQDVEVYPDEGMTEPPKPVRLVAVRDPRTAARAIDDRGRDVTARLARLDRVFVDDLPLERIRGYAKEHALTLDLAGLPRDRTRCCCSPAGPTTPSRATTSPRTRRASSLKPPRARGASARTARGRPRSRTSASPSAGRRRSSWTSRAVLGPVAPRAHRHDHAGLLGPGRGRGARRRRARSRRDRSTPVARRPARARLLGRGARRRPRALGLRLRARLARSRPGRRCRAATRARATCGALLARERRLFVVVEAGRRDRAELRRARPCRRCRPGWTRTFLLTATASARRWTSTPRARTSSCRCRSTA